MSVPTTGVAEPDGPPAPAAAASRWWHVVAVLLAVLLALSLLEMVTGADDLTSRGHRRRDPDRHRADHARRLSAACGPSARASSTSASRA